MLLVFYASAITSVDSVVLILPRGLPSASAFAASSPANAVSIRCLMVSDSDPGNRRTLVQNPVDSKSSSFVTITAPVSPAYVRI